MRSSTLVAICSCKASDRLVLPTELPAIHGLQLPGVAARLPSRKVRSLVGAATGGEPGCHSDVANALVMVRSYMEKTWGVHLVEADDLDVPEDHLLNRAPHVVHRFLQVFPEAVAVGHADIPTCDDEVVKVPAGRRGTGMRRQARRRHGGTGRRSLEMATDTTCMIEKKHKTKN